MSKKLCFNPQYREESFLFYSVKIGFGTHTVSYSMGILDITGGTEANAICLHGKPTDNITLTLKTSWQWLQ
jgi:hypothetical protein